jgi:hypothetical protein
MDVAIAREACLANQNRASRRPLGIVVVFLRPWSPNVDRGGVQGVLDVRGVVFFDHLDARSAVLGDLIDVGTFRELQADVGVPDARITEQYLAARLDELRWASAVQHLVIQSREEQREAKERAREEARAKKEIERALRDAAKEETILQRAIEQAKEQFEHASGEQKTMYEARLQEMSQRLQEAMERKDRARSMAEQTKRGHVYIISNLGSFGDDVFTIGLTRRWDPNDRIAELGGASMPFGFDVHAMILSEDAPALEYRLHEHFMLQQVNKVNHRKEFFRATLKEIRDEIEKLGVAGVSWTMTALAKEYRETLATEKKIAESPAEREQWLRQQRHLEFEPDYDELELVGVVADDD